MSMAKVLLYNFREGPRRKKVKALLFRFGIPSRDVAPEEQGLPIAALLGLAEAETAAETAPAEAAAPFMDEMILMHGLDGRQFHGFLDGMKAAGVRVDLKAVTTGQNLAWTSLRLHEELAEERRALGR